MLEKGKGQAVLDALEERWEQRERYNKEKSLIERKNPLSLICVGTVSEVLDARKLAKEIVLPMHYSSEIEEDCVQLVAFAFLHLIYLHGADKRIPFPAMDTVASFLQGCVVEEEEMDEDGKNVFRIHPKSFWDMLPTVCCSEYFDSEKEITLNRYSYDKGCVFYGNIKSLYQGYSDVIKCDLPIHPWIYKVALALSSRSKKLVNERAYLASLALQNYIDNNAGCRMGKIDLEINRFSFESFDDYEGSK